MWPGTPKFSFLIGFSLSFFYLSRLWTDWQKSFNFRQFFLPTCMTKIGCPSLDKPANYCVYVLKLRLYYQSAGGHQAWQDVNLPWWAPI